MIDQMVVGYSLIRKHHTCTSFFVATIHMPYNLLPYIVYSLHTQYTCIKLSYK